MMQNAWVTRVFDYQGFMRATAGSDTLQLRQTVSAVARQVDQTGAERATLPRHARMVELIRCGLQCWAVLIRFIDHYGNYLACSAFQRRWPSIAVSQKSRVCAHFNCGDLTRSLDYSVVFIAKVNGVSDRGWTPDVLSRIVDILWHDLVAISLAKRKAAPLVAE